MNYPSEEALRVSPGAKTILDRIEANVRSSYCIIGLSLLGSFARGDASYYSDIDLVAVIRDECEGEKSLSGIMDGIDFTILTTKNSKHVLYALRELQKIELTILREIDLGNIETMFRGSRISNTDTAVIIDKSGKLRNKLNEWLIPPGQKPSRIEVNEEARSFLYYYESMNVPLSRGDTYRAYFLYSLMYFKLAAIMYAYLGKGDFLYEPEFLVSALRDHDPQLAARFKKLLPTLSPPDLNENREDAYDLFSKILAMTPSVDREVVDMAPSIKQFVKYKYPNLWKLRDLGYEYHIAPGRVYRSARLTVYKRDTLDKWISKLGLKTIVDLRGDEEVEIDPYDPKALKSANYVRSPIIGRSKEGSATDEHDDASSVNLKMKMYETATTNESVMRAVKTIFTLLSEKDNIPLLFHCTSGSDRTGILAATIEGMTGIPYGVILNNYLASSTLLKSDYIAAFLKRVELTGGFASFIEKAGVSPGIIESARRNIAHLDSLEEGSTD